MSSQKQIIDELKSDGIHLSEEDLQTVVRFLNSLAKIEYEVYRQQKAQLIHGQFPNGRDIGLNNEKLAA